MGELFDARPVNATKHGTAEHEYEEFEAQGGAVRAPKGHWVVTPIGSDGKPYGLPLCPSDAAFKEQYEAVVVQTTQKAIPAKTEGSN